VILPSLAGRLALALLAALALASAADAKARVQPDLTVGAVGAVPRTLRASQEFALDVTVRNAGRRKAGRSVVRFYLSADTRRDARDLRLTGLLSVKPLAPHRKAKGRALLRAPGSLAGGTFQILACGDDLAKVAEANERNNCRAGGNVLVSGPEPASGPPAPRTYPPASGGPGAESPAPAPSPEPDTPPSDPNTPTPLDPGAATPLIDAAGFIFKGPDAIQQGVAPGTISARRIAVVRGRARDIKGDPIDGVRVTVLDHGEYGHTWTRADGHFDMVVNGAELDLVYEKDGYLPVQRQIEGPWQDYLNVDDVVMVPPDRAVTEIDPDSSAPFQVARGSSGGGGTPATLLFPQGTHAMLELPDGTTRPASTMHVRATEFPAGSELSLPGSMPGNVGPTYAVEFTLDEGIQAGAGSVSFDKDVLNYTDNFIDMPIGSVVPTAYYDRGRGQWVPSRNGIVLAITGESGGKAEIDADATPGPDTPAHLTALGITDAERAKLAELYDPGKELWRVPIRHFTPWDHNFPYGPPQGSEPPKLKEFVWKDPNDPCNKSGSIIACESQTLSEEIPVTGTEFRLRYDSSRQPGYKANSTLEVPITDNSPPPKLQGIEVSVDIAGRHMTKRWCDPSFPATGEWTCAGYDRVAPNLTYKVDWDGKDAFGREVQGRPLATVSVTYVYEFVYYKSTSDLDRSFGSFPESSNTVLNGGIYCANVNPAAPPEQSQFNHFYCGLLAKQTVTRALGPWVAEDVDNLGGLTLSAHHSFDPNEQVLYRGDGGVIRSEPLGSITRTLAGGGKTLPGLNPVPAKTVNIDYLTDTAIGPDGSIYGHSGLNLNRIWRVDPKGDLRVIGGRERGSTDADRGDPTGDGGPAVDAVLGADSMGGLDVAPDGSVYFTITGADFITGYVRRIRPDGIIETIAGTKWSNSIPLGDNGDGGPAKDARLGPLGNLEVAPDGSIYFGERAARPNSNRELLRRITPQGTITTVAGGGADAASDDEDLGDGEPAREAQLSRVYGIAAADDGTVYISDPVAKVVQRVTTDGRIHRVVGNHTTNLTFGGVGAGAGIGEPTDLALSRGGALYVRTNDFASPGSDVKIVKIETDGRVTPIAGRTTTIPCTTCLSPDGEGANLTMIESNSTGLDVLPNGRLVYGDGRFQVRSVEPSLPGFDGGGIAIPSTDGAELYLFDEQGRHLKTLDAVTGALRYQFGYDAGKRLLTVTDGNGRVTRIERAADGKPDAIVSPGGARTKLVVDGQGRLAAVENPAHQTTTLGYGAAGLLSSFSLPGRPAGTFEYDAVGRLVKDTSPNGAVQTLERIDTPSSTTVKVTSGEGRVTQYVSESLADGDRRRAIIRPSGATTDVRIKADGTRVRTEPDGTKTTTTLQRDPRWGMRAPIPATEVTETPGGRKRTVEVQRSVSLANPDDPMSVQTLTTTVTKRAGTAIARDATTVYDAVNHKLEHRSETNRITTAKLDDKGRVIEVDPDGPSSTALAPIKTTFDATGHVARIEQGAQFWTFAYDGRDRLVSRTDAKGHQLTFAYDDADRLTRKTLPAGRDFFYGWRPDGAISSLTMPSGAAYQFTADDIQRPVSLKAPGAGSAYSRAIDKDGLLEAVGFPTGATRDVTLGPGGLEAATDYGPEKDELTYPQADERPSVVTRTPDGGQAQSLTLGQDGLLPKAWEFGGPAAGRFSYSYDDFLELTGVTLASGNDTVSTAYAYDNDGFATKYGPFTLGRTGPMGRVGTIGDGSLSATYTYDALGRLAKRQLSAGGGVRYSNDVTYGSTGQVESRTEVVNGASRTLTYVYDANERLQQVKLGGNVVESYDYDANGNRIKRTLDSQETSSFDAQDRIQSRGGVSYDVDADGFMTRRGADTFTYSPSGALLSAGTIRYGYDALGRRVTRTDASGTTQYLYGDPGNPFMLSASRSAAGVLTTYYYDDQDALMAFERGGTRYYVGSDQVGTPRVVFKADGTVVKRIDYDAFGDRMTDSDPSFELPIGFAGGLADAKTGLVRFGARDYDPAAGRFTARDPIFFSGSPANLFVYANSDPVTLRDPTGLWCVGASGYEGIGGGGQYCRKDGKQSICVEGGVGAGGGVEIDPFGGAAESSALTFQAELTKKVGPVSATLGFEMDLDCFNTKTSAKLGTALGVGIGIDSEGQISSTFGGSGPEDFNGRGERHDDGSWGVKTEGKIAMKKCWTW
jgi:RHS repeat-associated protein